MHRTRVLSVFIALLAALATACTSNQQVADPSSTGPGATGSLTSSAPPVKSTGPTTTSKPTKSSTPPKTVPVDRIPPGDPASWVPKGVPTKARYRESGDKVPRFTQAMFHNDQNGAIATAVYYLAAQNWSLALQNNRPVNIVCQAKRCQTTTEKFRKLRDLGEHIVGGRVTAERPHLRLAVVPNGSKWIYRIHLTTDAYRVVDSSGATIDSYPAQTSVRTNIYLRWTGKMWSIILQSTVR